MATNRRWRDGGRVRLVLRALLDRFRSSMFGVPALWLAGSVALSQIATAIDRGLDPGDLPAFLDTTVDSARAILSAVSSGTIAAASVVFSLTLVAVQLSSSVYSSRVLRTFLRDRFQQHMIGLVTATFLYSLLVLREVRGPLEDSGSAYIPRVSVFLAVVLALAAVLALLASISHTSQSLRVSAVTRSLVFELRALIEDRFPEAVTSPHNGDSADDDTMSDVNSEIPAVATDGPGVAPARRSHAGPDTTAADAFDTAALGAGLVLTAAASGWLQQISVEALREAVPGGSTIRLDVVVGSYVAEGVPILTLWPPPPDAATEQVAEDLRGAFGIGSERTLHQDVAFGIVMIEDVAVKALSPGVNDPNTAKAVIVQLGEILLAILSRDLPPAELDIDGCRFLRSNEPAYHDYVDAAFNQIRTYASDQPSVQLVIVQTLLNLVDELQRRHRTGPPVEAVTHLLGFVERDLAPAERDPDARRARAALSLRSAPTSEH